MRRFTLALLLAATASAHAVADDKKPPSTPFTVTLDLSGVVKSRDGVAIYDDFAEGKQTPGKKCGDAGEKPCLTYARAAINALLLCVGPPFCPDEKPNGVAKNQRSKWTDPLYADPAKVEMTDEEANVVRGVVGELYNPTVVRAVWDVIPEPAKK